MKNYPIPVEPSIWAEQNEIKIKEVEHVPIRLDQEEVKGFNKQTPNTLK